jgi:segregation and condensation protein B
VSDTRQHNGRGYVRQEPLEIAVTPAGERAAALEALLFASGEPEEIATLAAALEWPPAQVRVGLDELEEQLREGERGIMLQRDETRVQLVSAPRFGPSVTRLLGLERTQKLSGAALETLALIAYRQPATRGELEAVRGVDCSAVIATLVARELIEPLGKRPTPGNPTEFGTTPQFLQFFGLASLDELPPLEE